jgi:hypothetical protein
MIQATPPSDFDWMTLRLSIASLVVAIVSFVSSLVSAAIANRSMKDAKRIADRAHDEWAQQKWFDLYFSANSAYDAMEKLQADSVVQKSGTINIHGGNYPDCANEVINGVSAVSGYRHALCRHFWICRRSSGDAEQAAPEEPYGRNE